MKTASNCQIAGALQKWQVKNDIYEQASTLLDLLCITRPDFQEAKRVIVNGHVIYSRMYEKMKKHCGYAFLIEHNGENFLANSRPTVGQQSDDSRTAANKRNHKLKRHIP